VAVLTNDVEQRLQAVAEQLTPAVELLDRKTQTLADMLARFGPLMNDGISNLLFSGGTGDITPAGRVRPGRAHRCGAPSDGPPLAIEHDRSDASDIPGQGGARGALICARRSDTPTHQDGVRPLTARSSP
jgi:hypothetical protein